MVPLSKSVNGHATESLQMRFCGALLNAKPTFVSGSATLCWRMLNSLSPRCRQNNDFLKGLRRLRGGTFRKEFASQPKCGLNVLSWSLAPLFKKRRDINVRASRPFLLLEHLGLLLTPDFPLLLAIDRRSLRFQLVNYRLGSLESDKGWMMFT